MSASSTQFTFFVWIPTARARPAPCGRCARGGTHTRSRGSRSRRRRSAPPRPRAGRSCLPASGTPMGRCLPSALGMYARLTGFARYARLQPKIRRVRLLLHRARRNRSNLRTRLRFPAHQWQLHRPRPPRDLRTLRCPPASCDPGVSPLESSARGSGRPSSAATQPRPRRTCHLRRPPCCASCSGTGRILAMQTSPWPKSRWTCPGWDCRRCHVSTWPAGAR